MHLVTTRTIQEYAEAYTRLRYPGQDGAPGVIADPKEGLSALASLARYAKDKQKDSA